jgi:tetratricopeptide (TPR) repeat protein
MNYLGYMWAEHDTCLDSAKTLMERAIYLDSTNGAFLDSYAWVLYKLDMNKDALTTIKKALSFMADDPVIYEHLGDILLKSNNRKEACNAYRKSFSLGPEDREKLLRKLSVVESECLKP